MGQHYFETGQNWVFQNCAAPFQNWCPILEFQNGAAPFQNGADSKMGLNIDIKNFYAVVSILHGKCNQCYSWVKQKILLLIW